MRRTKRFESVWLPEVPESEYSPANRPSVVVDSKPEGVWTWNGRLFGVERPPETLVFQCPPNYYTPEDAGHDYRVEPIPNGKFRLIYNSHCYHPQTNNNGRGGCWLIIGCYGEAT